MNKKFNNLAERLKALSETNRLRIIEMLALEDMCVCEIIEKLELSQPAVSHHLKVLKQAKLIVDRKDGKWISYSLDKTELENVLHELRDLCSCQAPVKEKHKPDISCDFQCPKV